LLCSWSTPPALAAEVVLTAGQVDSFVLPADPASPSAVLLTLGLNFQNFDLVAGFNGGLPDRQVAHTFANLPPGIDAATLQLRIRAGNDAGVDTDGLLISFVDATTTVYCDDVAWGRPFAPYTAAGCFPEPDPAGLVGSWSAGDTVTLVLDLSALPLAGGGTLNLLPQINSAGFIDVNVSDETGCDFMRLSIDTTMTTSVDGPVGVPELAVLHRPLPNPFGASTAFRFELSRSAEVTFSVFDVAGRRVRVLAEGVRPGGLNEIVWDGKDDHGTRVSSGIYFGTLRAGSRQLATKAVLLR
jgi:hypothetical protein